MNFKRVGNLCGNTSKDYTQLTGDDANNAWSLLGLGVSDGTI